MKTKLVLAIIVVVAVVSFGASRSNYSKKQTQIAQQQTGSPTIGGLVIDNK